MSQTDSSTFDEALRVFCSALADGRPLTAANLAEVEEILEATPYFTLPAAILLKSGATLDEGTRRRLSERVALNAPDADALFRLLDADGLRLTALYPPEQKAATPSTEEALDTFLNEYGSIDPHEQQLLEKLIFNPVPDYSQVLAAESQELPATAASPQDAMLDAFLASQSRAARTDFERHAAAAAEARRSAAPAAPDAEAPLSESLARIYIRQGRYDKAYEIIRQLSLNFPKKSIYFADQLRFLKKLMLVSNA